MSIHIPANVITFIFHWWNFLFFFRKHFHPGIRQFLHHSATTDTKTHRRQPVTHRHIQSQMYIHGLMPHVHRLSYPWTVPSSYCSRAVTIDGSGSVGKKVICSFFYQFPPQISPSNFEIRIAQRFLCHP
jgi:hypothetical protein